MMTKKGSTKTVNFMNPEAEALVLGRARTWSYNEYMYYLLLYQYTAH